MHDQVVHIANIIFETFKRWFCPRWTDGATFKHHHKRIDSIREEICYGAHTDLLLLAVFFSFKWVGHISDGFRCRRWRLQLLHWCIKPSFPFLVSIVLQSALTAFALSNAVNDRRRGHGDSGGFRKWSPSPPGTHTKKDQPLLATLLAYTLKANILIHWWWIGCEMARWAAHGVLLTL